MFQLYIYVLFWLGTLFGPSYAAGSCGLCTGVAIATNLCYDQGFDLLHFLLEVNFYSQWNPWHFAQ